MRMLFVLAFVVSLLLAVSGSPLAKVGEWRAYAYGDALLEGESWELHLHGELAASGEYYVFYGSAGFFGDQLPPKEIRRAGPFKAELGKGYVCVFKGAGVQWSELQAGSFVPREGKAVIYVRNERSFLDRLFLGVMVTDRSSP